MPAELWKGFGGDGINETCRQEPHFTVARGDVLLQCKLFSPKISQQPSRQDWWQEATCHLWPATLPSSTTLHILATLVVTFERCKNTACCPEKKTATDRILFLFYINKNVIETLNISHTNLIRCKLSLSLHTESWLEIITFDHQYITFATFVDCVANDHHERWNVMECQSKTLKIKNVNIGIGHDIGPPLQTSNNKEEGGDVLDFKMSRVFAIYQSWQ